VVVLAQEEARMLSHVYIGTEHILLGLIHEGEGVAAKALESLDISLEAVRRQVEEIMGQGKAAPTGHIPFTPRAKKVLELSFREAKQLGHNHIGTEHILLGLIREGEGVAAQILQKLGADLKRVRRTVIKELSGSPAVRYGDMPSPSPFDEREKILLSLLMHEGLTTSEIAKLLGVSEEKVGEIVQAVIEKLKDL
jgi:ATP-dependent Clp protease ATP-binding subunit ClpC